MSHIWIRKSDISPDVWGRQTVGCPIEGCPWTETVSAIGSGRHGDRDGASKMNKALDSHLDDCHRGDVRARGGVVSEKTMRRVAARFHHLRGRG